MRRRHRGAGTQSARSRAPAILQPRVTVVFYEPLGLGEGHRFLEIGVGSGYGTALARVPCLDGYVRGMSFPSVPVARLSAASRRVHHGSTSAKTRDDTRPCTPLRSRSFCRVFSTSCARVSPPFMRRSTTHNREVGVAIESTSPATSGASRARNDLAESYSAYRAMSGELSGLLCGPSALQPWGRWSWSASGLASGGSGIVGRRASG